MQQINSEIFTITSAQVRVLKPVSAVIPFQDSTMGPFCSFGISVITLTDDEGNTGEAPVYSSYAHILEKCLLPILFYCKKVSYPDLYQKLYWSIRNEGFRGQASALLGQLDMALYDLAAKRKGLPLHQYLNAGRNYVEMYGSGGGTNYTCAQLENEVRFFLDKGVKTYKMKVGKEFGANPQEDIQRVKFVRSLIGKEIKLALDCNQVWNKDQALQFIHAVEGENIEWIEEPVHSADLVEIEQVCKASPVKIAYGESERSAKTFPALINAGVQHLQPIPTQISSIKEWMDVRDLAFKHELNFSSGGYSLYTAGLMATAPEHRQVEYLFTIMQGLEQYFAIRPDWCNGRFILPETAGGSVQIDWDYCLKNNKIIKDQSWTKDKISKYVAAVSV